MYAKIRGTEIYFDIAGMQLQFNGKKLEERPVLFLLHGGPGGDHLRFKQHSSSLQEVAQLVFIDHRGCGRSKKTNPKEYTLDNNVEDIEALRKYLGLKKICILGGSYGGMVAQGYAIRYPQNVEKLILAVTTPSHRFLERARKNLHERGTPKQIKVAEDLLKGKLNTSKKLDNYFTLTEDLYSTTAKKTKKPIYGRTHTVWSHEALNAGFGGFLRTFDFVPQLKKIKAPTLVLAGDRDWICDPEESKIIAKNIPNAKLKIFKNCGHAIANDAQKEYLKSIKTFLKKKK